LRDLIERVVIVGLNRTKKEEQERKEKKNLGSLLLPLVQQVPTDNACPTKDKYQKMELGNGQNESRQRSERDFCIVFGCFYSFFLSL